MLKDIHRAANRESVACIQSVVAVVSLAALPQSTHAHAHLIAYMGPAQLELTTRLIGVCIALGLPYSLTEINYELENYEP